MGISVYPPVGSSAVAPNLSYTVSQIAWQNATFVATNDSVAVVTMYQRAFSGAMFSLWGTYTNLAVTFEAGHFAGGPVIPAPAWHMRQGVQVVTDYLPNNGACAYWVPANGATTLSMRCASIGSGSVSTGAMAMHAPATIPVGPVNKMDWQGMVVEATPGNNVQAMQQMVVTAATGLPARSSGLVGTTYTVPLTKRLRLHSWAGSFLAGAAGGKCRVDLRSNLNGATTTASDILGTWLFGPQAGGVNPDERWSGLSGSFPEPIDFYNYGPGTSLGLGATGSAGTNGKLSFTLFGHLVG